MSGDFNIHVDNVNYFHYKKQAKTCQWQAKCWRFLSQGQASEADYYLSVFCSPQLVLMAKNWH